MLKHIPHRRDPTGNVGEVPSLWLFQQSSNILADVRIILCKIIGPRPYSHNTHLSIDAIFQKHQDNVIVCFHCSMMKHGHSFKVLLMSRCSVFEELFNLFPVSIHKCMNDRRGGVHELFAITKGLILLVTRPSLLWCRLASTLCCAIRLTQYKVFSDASSLI